jgi:hypothetical protein
MSRTFCERAIAYLKPVVADDDDAAPVIALEHPNGPVLRVLLPKMLVVSYLVDSGDRLEYVQGRHLREAAMTEDELHAIGLENLAQHCNESMKVHPQGAIFAIVAGGNYEASYLLLDDLWDRALREVVPGPPVVALPARDLLAFGDRDSPEAIAELRAMVARTSGKVDHPLTERLLERRDGAWVPL